MCSWISARGKKRRLYRGIISTGYKLFTEIGALRAILIVEIFFYDYNVLETARPSFDNKLDPASAFGFV